MNKINKKRRRKGSYTDALEQEKNNFPSPHELYIKHEA